LTDEAFLWTGEVDQADQTFLKNEQIAHGFFLTSVAFSRSDLTFISHVEDYLY
jgi:hypothetical protein